MRVLAAVLAFVGCSSKLVDQRVIGEWTASGQAPSGPGGERGMGWMKQYDFRKNGTFEMNGYPPIIVTGEWSVTASENGTLVLTLSKQKMRASKTDAPADWPDRKGPLVIEQRRLVFDSETLTRR